jgi:DNA invertase Pin-like site-specific DNA recombinase
MSNLLLSVMGAFAEFVRELIRERQREGIELAKKAGAYRGRKKTLTLQRAAELRRRLAKGEGKAALAREFGIDRTTVYRYAKWKEPSVTMEEVNARGGNHATSRKKHRVKNVGAC